MNYVIIGNGAAGVSAAENLRKLDVTGTITMITAEPYQAYSKCLLSDYLAKDDAGRDSEENGHLYFKDNDFYTRSRIQILFKHRVNDIDFHRKVIKILDLTHPGAKDSELSYDRLLIATGSKPVMTSIKGYQRANPYYLNTLDDAKRIVKAIAGSREAVIVGAGFVGLEVAFNLRKRGLKVTLIDKANRILPAQLDEIAAKMITQALESEGIKVCLGAGITEVVLHRGILWRNRVKGVVLENGNTIGTDMLVIAAGSVPNLDFITPGKLEVGRGIIVNRQMMTSVPDVYAAGDVAQFTDVVTGESMPTPIWPNAVIEGEYAAYNMAGLRRELDQLIGMQNAAEFREIPLVSMGLVDAAGPKVETLIDFRSARGIYRKIVLRDNRIIGMIFLGDISQSGVIGALIKNQTPVGHLKANLLAPGFGYSMVAGVEDGR
jgi:NAD(P)H-nitrite reductase large subunit